MALSSKLRERLAAFAQEIQAELGTPSPDDSTCFFTVLEDLAAEVGDALACQVMEQQSPALEPTTIYRCPTCERVGRLKKLRSKKLQTRRGPVALTEPECYCAGCRRSFFPSHQTVGDRAGQ